MDRLTALAILQERKAQLTVGDNWREIVDPNFYVNAGWPSHWIDSMHRSHQAESGTVQGVWHLDFLRKLSGVLGIKVADDFGAYMEARQMAIKIWEMIYEMKESKDDPSKKEAGAKDE